MKKSIYVECDKQLKASERLLELTGKKFYFVDVDMVDENSESQETVIFYVLGRLSIKQVVGRLKRMKYI
jgi:predicted transcriptional regulator of viral defense system